MYELYDSNILTLEIKLKRQKIYRCFHGRTESEAADTCRPIMKLNGKIIIRIGFLR